MLANTSLIYHKIERNSKITFTYHVTHKRVRILLSNHDENGKNWSKLDNSQVKLIHQLKFFSLAKPVKKNSPVKRLAGEEIYSPIRHDCASREKWLLHQEGGSRLNKQAKGSERDGERG